MTEEVAPEQFNKYMKDVINELDKLQFGQDVILIIESTNGDEDSLADVLSDITVRSYQRGDRAKECAHVIANALIQMNNPPKGMH